MRSTYFSKTCTGVFVATAAIVILAILYVDIPVATLVKRCDEHKVIREVLNVAEPFGTPYGQIFILIVIYLMDNRPRRDLFILSQAGLLAGLMGLLAKRFVPRFRPKYVDFSNTLTDFGFLEFAPGASAGACVQSFPSAHTASAVAFFLVLTHMYPKGRSLFFTMALLVGLHRIDCSAHFVSDVFAGAFVGWIIGRLFIPRGPITTCSACHYEDLSSLVSMIGSLSETGSRGTHKLPV